MVIIEWLKSCLRHLVICFWVRFISLLASEVEPLPKVKWCEPRGEETTPKKTTEDKNDSDGNKSKEKDEYKNEHECRNEDDQEVILYPEEPKERIQVAYVEPKLLTEDEAHSVPAEEPALSTDESEDNAWEGEEPCVRASITVGNVHTSAKQSESSSYLSCHLQEAKVANTEAKLPQLKQRVGNANLEKSEDEDDDDDSPWIGLGHSTRLTRYSGVQDLLAHSEETPSVIDKRVPGNVLRREGPLLLPRSSFIRSRSLEKSQLEEIPEEDRRLSIDESTSENQSDKIWAQLVAKYAEEQPHQETAEEFQGDSTCEKVGDEKGLKENEDCKGISTHSFLSMKTASDASTDFTDENMMSEKFSAQVGQRLNMYLARLEESKEDSEVEGKDAAEEAREVEYDSLDIEMEEGSEDKILIMIEDDESNGDRSEVQNDQNKKTFEDNLGEIVEKSTHLPHLVDSGESNNGILNFSKLPDEELGVELSIENRESLRPQGISECHPSESCSGGEKRKEYQEGPLLRDSEALTSIELEKIQESQRVDENEKLSKGMELENVTSDPAIKDIDFETNTDSQSISLKNEEPESFKDKQQIIPITTSKVNEGERSDQLIRSHSSPDETICESVLPKLSEISRNIIESPTQGRNEEPQGNLLSQKQEETTVIKDSLGKEAVIATPTDEDFAQMLECVDNRTQATEVDKTNQTLQGVTETELEVKANISKANEIKVEEVLPIESTDPKEDVPIFNIKLRRKSSPVVASDEHVVEELPEVSFSVPIRRKSKGEESLRKKALENLRRKNSSETGQISFEMRQDLISEKSEKEMAEVDDTQDETTKTIEEKEDTDKGEQSKNREELKETEDQLLHRGNEKGTLIVCDEIKNNKDANEASPQVMDLLKRRTSRDLWKMECDKLLEVRNKDDAEDADVIQEADVFNTRYEEFPEDYVSIETFNPIDLTYFIDQSKEGNERDEQLDELSLKEEGHSLQQNTRDDNENLKGDKENYLTATNKSRIDVKEALDSKTIPQTGTKVNAMEIKLTDEETQIIDSEKHKEEVDFVSEVYSEQLIQNPDEVANVRNALTFSEEDLVAKILSQKSNEDYQDNTTTEEFCKISQNEILKIDEKPEKSDIFKENIVKDDVVLEKNKTVDMSLSKESEEALQSHITDSGHSEKEHLLNLIRKERDGEKRSLSEEEIPDYLDEFKDLLVPRARRKKAKKRITAITDIVDLDEPKLSSELLKFSDAEASSVRNDLYDPVINETGKEIATHEFLPDEEGSNEFQEMKEQRTYKEAQRKELEKYLSMPDALTEEEQQELEELLAREESEKAIVAASEARLDSILSEVRKRLDTSEIDDGNLEHFLNLPVALSKEEENLLTTAEKEENEPKDFETEDEYREFIRQRYLDELEEDRLRVEDEELDFGGSYYEEDDDYEYDYKEYDGDLEGLIFTKDMEAEGKGEEGASGFEDKAVGSDDLLENLGENRKEIKTKEPKAFFSLANLKLTRKSTPRGSRESIGRTASQDSSKEESTGEEFSHTSKKFFRYGSPGVKRKKKCQTNGNGSFGESPEPMDDVEFEEEKSTIGEFAKNISDDDDVSQTNIHSLSIDGVCLKQDMSMSMKTLAEECENTQDKLTAIEVRCNASKEKEDGLTSGIVESGVNLAKVSTKEVLQDLSNGQIRTFFSTNPEVAPTTKIPLSQDSKGAVDNGSNDGLEEDIKVNHSRGDEIKRDTIAHGTYVVIMETEDCILSRVEERDKNSTKTAMPSSDSNLGGSEGTFSEQSVEVLEGETASPHVDEEKKNVRLEVSDLDETIMSGRRDFGRSSVTSTPAVNGGGYKSETANGDVWPEKDKKSKSAALDEFEKMEKEVMLEMEKNKEGDKKDKKKKKKKKKSDVEKENQKTTQRSKEGLLEKHVGPRIRSFDPAKMKTKFSKPKEPTQVSTDCRICGKQVFQMEKIVAEKASWHKNCFRCKECNKNLTLETYQSNEGTLYCKPHFKELFRPKAVVINEDEERKDRLMRRPRMIILESQPEALPDDVVRATDKPDYGLEELQQTLNVKQRFSMFENLAKETEKPSAEPISVRRSRSLMSKAARFLDGHDDKGDVDADYDEEEMSEEEYDEEEQCEDETEYESTNSIVRSKKKKERPMSFSGMGDLKAVWEQKQRREEMSQARKEEISKFRLMLCAGKNSTLKERFESGIFEEDEEEGEERRRNSKEEIKIEGKRVASNLMKKFERGEPFILEDEEDEEDEEEEENGITRKRERSGPEKKEVEEIFKEAETAKKARNVFKQIDQHVAQEGGPILRSHSFASTINQEHRRSLDSSALGHQTTRPPPEDVEVIKSGEKKEDFQVDTTDLASRFRFFLDYEKNKEKEKEEERKVFRITPPREGIDQVLQDVALTKANMPKPCMAVNCTVCKLIRGMQGTEDLEVLGRDPNLIKCTDNYQDDVDCGNTQNILQMFKKMEMGYDDEEEEEGPRPLKRFTPPPDGREYDDESEYSDEEYSEDEEDDEQDEDENQHPEVRDELLQMTAAPPQSARKAASLRAKFERWEAEVERNNDINKEKEELEECMPSLDTAKNLRAMFEHKASEVVKPIASKPITQKINRFV